MAAQIPRRDFLRTAGRTAAVTIGAGGSWAIAAPQGDVAQWAFPLLGDLHIDRLDHHDMHWLAKEHPGDVAQVQNYSRITREATPRLLGVVQQQMAESRLPVPFVVQVGDLIEGLCGSEELAARQADDAIALIDSAGFPALFLFTKGNHDITGPGAREVYDRRLVPFMAAQVGGEINGAAFSRERDDVLLVFYDAYDRGSLEWFAALMEGKKPRRLIFVIHPPVVPYNARSTWHVYSHPRQAAERQRLLELLGRSRAIVLSGHLHKYSFLVRRTESGRFAQLALSSVAASERAEPRDLIEGVDGYGPELVRREPRHSPETEERRRAVLQEERRFIEHFEYADTWGHALVALNAGEVRADVFRGLSRAPWKRLDITQWLDAGS